MSGYEQFKVVVDMVSELTIPIIILLIIGVAFIASAMGKDVKPYESFVEGGKEGFQIFLKILPYIIAIFIAIRVFRDCGALDILGSFLGQFTKYVGLPGELVPIALMKPLSGSGSLGLVADVVNKAPDSLEAFMASTMFGSTDTTFYVLALYFGSVGVKKIRHAMIVGLSADVVGILVAVWIARFLFSPA